jgi:membrane protein YdbS with pleckstrin-like domain
MSGKLEQSAASLYHVVWDALVRWFKVPGQPPALPVRQGEFIMSFRPAAGFLRYLKFWFWIILALTDIAFTAAYIGISIALIVAGLWWVAVLLLPVALFLIIAPDIIAYVAIHLRYDTTWYVMTDRSLRIRRGIWSIHETTITFENVQNVRMQQGPVQRHFGIATLMVETAGAGQAAGKGGQTVGNRGIIEGVDNAPELRDRILVRLRQSQTAGLGDEDDTMRRTGPANIWTPAHLAALKAVRDEARLLANIRAHDDR